MNEPNGMSENFVSVSNLFHHFFQALISPARSIKLRSSVTVVGGIAPILPEGGFYSFPSFFQKYSDSSKGSICTKRPSQSQYFLLRTFHFVAQHRKSLRASAAGRPSNRLLIARETP